MAQNFDTGNEKFHLAAGLVNNTNRNIFLTGKAGTGKTTFLRFIREQSVKQLAVVAPTGVAAINAGGTTIHSFFQLPFSPFIPETRGFGGHNVSDKNSLISRLRINSEKIKIFRRLELLIIDEISMVRCDMLDAIDTVLKHYRQRHNEPFGGVQVLMIGDLFQLPPVSANNEWEMLSEFYESPYFFDSHVFRRSPALYIEFDKIYRQQDDKFIRLLNNVRNNALTNADISLLNSLVNTKINIKNRHIILTTHNHKADEINRAALNSLKTKAYSYEAKIEGEFYEKSFPADQVLALKPGAQVMFIKNDSDRAKRYYNGKIGFISRIDADGVFVQCENEDEIEVNLETWENLRYTINRSTQQLEEERLGSFKQYPLRLAWAITVHKSQGLTFKNAVIDAGNAFASGQVYVALSRCTSLEGIQLTTPVNSNGLRTDERIVRFSEQQASSEELQHQLAVAKKEYEYSLLSEIFDLKITLAQVKELSDLIKESSKSFNSHAIEFITSLEIVLSDLQNVSDSFKKHLHSIFSKIEATDNSVELHERIRSGTVYFHSQLNGLISKMNNSPVVTESRVAAKSFNDGMRELHVLLSAKIHALNFDKEKFSVQQYHFRKKNFVTPYFSVNAYAASNDSDQSASVHPLLQSQLRQLRNKICEQNGAPIYMVASSKTIEEMAEFLPQTKDALLKISGFGKAKVEAYGEKFLEVIKKYCADKNLTSTIDLKKSGKPKKEKKEKVSKEIKPSTKDLSYVMFIEGKTIQQIAEERNLAISTIEGHMADFIEKGIIDLNKLMPEERIRKIYAELNSEESTLSAVKQKLSPDVSFGEIRLVMAYKKFKGRT